MEKRQCPNCGQYVAADRTYCMNCGTTLGIRCPDCKKVLPVGVKACDACGHSFVRKKQHKTSELLGSLRKHAKPILIVSVLLLAVLTLVTACLPSVSFSLTETRTSGNKEPVVTEWKASGFTLAGYLLGGHPEQVTSLLDQSAFSEHATGLKFALYGIGLGWLVLIVAAVLSLCLLLPNLRRLGKSTPKRMIPLFGTALGGAGLACGLHFVVRRILTRGASVVWPLPDETAETAAKASKAAKAAKVVYEWAVGGAAPAVIMTVLTLLLFGVLLYLYLTVFRKAEDNEEYALGYILKQPFVWLSGAVRKLIKKISGKKARKNEDEKTVTTTKRFTFYVILMIGALIFTQALLSKVSNILFWFILLLPGLLLLYTLVSKSALHVSMLSDSATTEKNAPYTYEFVVENNSILAFPFIEACVSIPQSNSVRCTERTVRLAMSPRSSYHMKNTVRFRFRGTYDIGVRCFYVYDFFRLFRVQVPIENMTTVYVLPRRLSLEETLAQSISDSTARTVRSPLVVDKLEVSDIREYHAGDSLKAIHWKLSSKSESFIVKDYNTGTSNQTVVYCDMAAHFPDEPPKKKAIGENGEYLTDENGSILTDENGNPLPKPKKKLTRKEKKAQKIAAQDKRLLAARRRRKDETPETHEISDADLEKRLSDRKTAADLLSADEKAAPAAEAAPAPEVHDVHELAVPAYYDDMNEYLADGVVELTIANVLAELHKGHEVLLTWFDRRSDTGVYAFPLRGIEEFERIYHLFGTAPLCDESKEVALLTAMAGDTESAKQLFTTSSLDSRMMASFSNLPGVSDAANFGSAEVLLYNPEERFRWPGERSLYLEGCREQLNASGLTLMVAGTQAVPDAAPSPEGGESR